MYKKKYSLLILIFSIFTVSSVTAKGLIISDLQQVLNVSQQSDPVNIIIDFSDRIDFKKTTHKGKKNRASLIRTAKNKSSLNQQKLIKFLASQNITKYKKLWLVNSLAVTVEANMVPKIAALVGVSRVHYDKIIKVNATTNSVPGTPELNIDMVKSAAVWNLGFTGQNVVIGILGTGVDVFHPDLATRYRGGNNSWFDPITNSTSPYDYSGHGTGVMGIALGGRKSGTNIGMAPGATWIAAKIFKDDGSGALTSDIKGAFQWMLDPNGDGNPDDAADIVNNSWNFEASVNMCLDDFQLDIDALKAADISVVFSAGNAGSLDMNQMNVPNTSVSPANNANTISVGAVNANKRIEDYSGHGATPTLPITKTCKPSTSGIYPNLVAPGAGIFTADRSLAGTNPNPYVFQTGTSFSAPHITGALALLQSAFPGTTSTEREQALRLSAEDLGTIGDDNSFGWGFLNIDAAYQQLLSTAVLVTTPPHVKNHLISATENNVTAIKVLSEVFTDSRVDPTNKIDLASVMVVSNPVNGDVTVDTTTGIVNYTPATDFLGDDSFSFTVTDTSSNISNTGQVDIKVVKMIPVAAPSGGGGCTVQQGSRYDPMLPMILLLSILYIIRSTRLNIKIMERFHNI